MGFQDRSSLGRVGLWSPHTAASLPSPPGWYLCLFPAWRPWLPRGRWRDRRAEWFCFPCHLLTLHHLPMLLSALTLSLWVAGVGEEAFSWGLDSEYPQKTHFSAQNQQQRPRITGRVREWSERGEGLFWHQRDTTIAVPQPLLSGARLHVPHTFTLVRL